MEAKRYYPCRMSARADGGSMLRLPIGMVSMSVALGTATAGPLDDAELAYSRGDRAATLRILRAHAGEDASST